MRVRLTDSVYVALMKHFTLFPCVSLQAFTLSFSLSFDYSGSSNAVDCTPQLLATLPPSVRSVTLDMNFVYVVQAAAVNLHWGDVHTALARIGRQLRGRGKRSGGIRFVLANEGMRIEDEERNGVEAFFMEKFHMVNDVLKVEFSPVHEKLDKPRTRYVHMGRRM